MSGWAGTSLSRRGWAELIAEENRELGYKPMTPRQLAEGLGVREAEGDTTTGAHIGPWEESTAFAGGSSAARLNYRTSTRAALENWHSNGNSWWTAWGNFETAETEGAGPTRYKRHLPLATAVLGKHKVTRARATTQKATSHDRAATEPAPESSSGGGFGEDLMHFGLVALLVLGGVVMIGMGTTRVLRQGRA